MTSPSVRAPKKDRTTLPAISLLVACGISAYGFQAESDALIWMVPGALVLASLVWSFWPSRPAAEKTDTAL